MFSYYNGNVHQAAIFQGLNWLYDAKLV